ncbi:MAG: hypothetical protein ACTSRZ_00620 [Promethearchaeota archaeon]
MDEKIYLNNIEESFSLYKRALSAKTPQNKIKLARKAEESLNIAIKYANKLKLKDKLPLIYEYITKIHILIAFSFYALKKIKDSVLAWKKAIESNEKSVNNLDKKERFALIYFQLATISSQIQQFDSAMKYADLALNYAKKLNDKDYLEYLYELNQIYIKGLNVKKVKLNFKQLLKLCEKNSTPLHLKAKIYFDYARYLFEVDKKYSECREFLDKSKNIFEILKEDYGVKVVQEYIASKFDQDNKPIMTKG